MDFFSVLGTAVAAVVVTAVVASVAAGSKLQNHSCGVARFVVVVVV